MFDTLDPFADSASVTDDLAPVVDDVAPVVEETPDDYGPTFEEQCIADGELCRLLHGGRGGNR